MKYEDLYESLLKVKPSDILLSVAFLIGTIVTFCIVDWRIGLIGLTGLIFSLVHLVIQAKLRYDDAEHNIIAATCVGSSRAEFGSFTTSKWYEFESIDGTTNVRLQISGEKIKKGHHYKLAFKGNNCELSNQSLLYIEPLNSSRKR